MATVYTRRLFGRSLVAGPPVKVYEVPDGVTVVVRDLVVYSAAPVAGNVLIYVDSPEGAYQIFASQFDAQHQYQHLELRQALNPGWAIYVFAAVDSNIGCTGYVLTLP